MAVPKKRTSKSKKNKRKSVWKKKAEIWRNIGITEIEFDPTTPLEPPKRLKGGLRIKNKSRFKLQLIKGQGFNDQPGIVPFEQMQVEIIPPKRSQPKKSQSKDIIIDITPSETLSSESPSSTNVQSEKSQPEKPL
jgi:hypothetical protein